MFVKVAREATHIVKQAVVQTKFHFDDWTLCLPKGDGTVSRILNTPNT